MKNPILDEMIGIYSGAVTEKSDDIFHYGKGHLDGGHSGRYPWGSGEDPYQHQPRMYGMSHEEFLSEVSRLEKEGATYYDKDTGKTYTGTTAIAKILGVNSTEFRIRQRYENHLKREEERQKAIEMRLNGETLQSIADALGYPNDSSIRNLLNNEGTADRQAKAWATADKLKEILDEKRIVDVGPGVAAALGVSENTLKEAEYILKIEGYNMYPMRREQITNPGKFTTVSTLALPEVEYKEVYGPDAIKSIEDYHSDDGGSTFRRIQYPASIDSSRVGVNYAENGGEAKDGLIEIRRGVPDLNLGDSHYAQVRILVDGTHYLKGMAVYSNDIPEGKDIMFNTNKTSDVPLIDGKNGVLKPIKDTDPTNPFGAYIKANGQSMYIGEDGKEHLSAINKLKSEGDWDDQQLKLSSQFLSKQPLKLIKTQLDLSYKDKVAELDEIESLENPTIKKKYLIDFAQDCDSSAQHLQAAALPRQSNKVILPLPGLKDDEVYAPTYKDGEQLALIRYPHAGTFEIPILTVNNKSRKLRDMIDPASIDAIGITPVAAKQLSGADFDGDSVVVIPLSSKVRIKNEAPLKELQNFDHLTQYKIPEGSKIKPMSKDYQQKQMGIVSNLITDMTLRGAEMDEIVRAVKHSMVVIDAVKHELDYRQSAKDNNIQQLVDKYQLHVDNVDGKEKGGASTLISRRKQEIDVPERRGSMHINPDGTVWYNETGREYVDKKGNTVPATQKSKLLVETPDLHTLSSGTRQEEMYADYGNKLKALANKARKEAISVSEAKKDPEAAKQYSTEVNELLAALAIAESNAPKERRAQSIAWAKVNELTTKNPELKDKSNAKELSKIQNAAILDARLQVGANSKDTKIKVSDNQWKAIQAHAISPNTLNKILKYTDADSLRDRAMPKQSNSLSTAQVSRIKALSSSGYTPTEIAEITGRSVSTVTKYLNPNNKDKEG